MQRSTDVRQIERAKRRIVQRAQVTRRALYAARARRDALVAEHARWLGVATASQRSMRDLCEQPGAVDRRTLYAMLQMAGKWRLRWSEARAQADLVQSDIQSVEAEIDTCRRAALAAHDRVERLERWLKAARRAAGVRADRRMQDQIEDISWTFCQE